MSTTMAQAKDTPQLLAEATAALDRLATAVAAENAALRATDLPAVRTAGDEKRAATALSESGMAALRKATDNLKDLDADARGALRERHTVLASLAEENARLLRIAVETGRRFMAGMAETVARMAPGPGTYGSTGALATTRGPCQPAGLAVSFDRSL